jgi:hypothetical protein
MFEKIMPPEIMWAFKLPEYDVIEPETALVNQAVVESGLWNQTTGAAMVFPDARRLQLATVKPESIMYLQHKGDRRDVIIKKTDNSYFLYVLPALMSNQTGWYIKMPADAVSCQIGIASNGQGSA